MPGKSARLLLTLLASVGIPYLWFSDFWRKSSEPKAAVAASRDVPSFHFSGGPELPSPDAPPVEAVPQDSPTPAANVPINQLADVLRFDVTPDWVTQRWPRVSNVRCEQNLDGMRVALVTGTDLDDVAGSLTYYFDMLDRVARISFQGQTGNDRQIVELATKAYGLHPEPALGAGIYLTRWNAVPISVLRINFAPVVRADRPHERLQVFLEINRPDLNYGLSPEFQRLLLREQQTLRW